MNRPWRGGLIGCGFFALTQMHAWKNLPGADIVTVCDVDLEKAETLGRTFGIASVYSDAVAMLEREELEFIDIVTTIESHRMLVELGARYGTLIICQKPIAATLEDADAMVRACRAAGVPFVIHENFRWQRPFLELSGWMADGAIGEPISLHLTFRHIHDIYRNQPYLAKIAQLALMDVGPHLFDLVRFLVGDVIRLNCRTQHLNPKVRGEDAFLAELYHSNGAVSIVDCSFFDHERIDMFPQTLACIEGANGCLELLPGYRVRRTSGGISREFDAEPALPPWGAKPWHCIQDSVLNFQAHILEVLNGNAVPSPSGAHNRDTLALVLAAYESAERGEDVVIRRPEETA